MRPQGGQRHVLGALLCVCFLISELIPLTSLAGRRPRPQDYSRRSAAADVSGGGHGPGITAPGCGHEAEKGASSRTQFF